MVRDGRVLLQLFGNKRAVASDDEPVEDPAAPADATPVAGGVVD